MMSKVWQLGVRNNVLFLTQILLLVFEIWSIERSSCTAQGQFSWFFNAQSFDGKNVWITISYEKAKDEIIRTY